MVESCNRPGTTAIQDLPAAALRELMSGRTDNVGVNAAGDGHRAGVGAERLNKATRAFGAGLLFVLIALTSACSSGEPGPVPMNLEIVGPLALEHGNQ